MDGKPYHYKLGIKSKSDSFDQKTKVIHLRPGFITLIKVATEITEISKNFASLDQATRKCKLSHETEGFQFLRNYTKTGCEFECAAKAAMKICKCLPWYYPNNFTDTAMCEPFGAKCFDEIMSDGSHYKSCQDICLEDCEFTGVSMFPTFMPIDGDDFCQIAGVDLENLENHRFKFATNYEKFMLKLRGIDIPDGLTCQSYLEKYVAIVSIDTPSNSAIKSRRDETINFSGRLATIGGTLGLFAGISILSMVEVLCIIFSFVNLIVQFIRCKMEY